MQYADYSSKLNKALASYELHKERLAEITETIDTEKVPLLKNTEEAQAFLQKVAQETQEQLKYHIQDIVQMALNAVFPGKYEFMVDYEIKRGKTEARIYLKSGDTEIDPMTECGGGVVDIIALALRITAYTLSNTSNTIILDEPMRFVSKDLQYAAAEIIKHLSEKLNVQFIIVTHNTELIEYTDKVFNVSIENGISIIK